MNLPSTKDHVDLIGYQLFPAKLSQDLHRGLEQMNN